MNQEDKRVITKQLLESKYTRVNSYQLERDRRKQELEAKTAALQLDDISSSNTSVACGVTPTSNEVG